MKNYLIAILISLILCGCGDRCAWKQVTKRPLEIGQILTAPQRKHLVEATEISEKFLISRTIEKSCMHLRATRDYWVTCDRKTGKIIAIWTKG